MYKIKCLVVEDEAIHADWLCEQLAHFEEIDLVGKTGTPDDAFRLIINHKPDAVFLDLKLFGGTGFDILRRLKAANAAIPAIIILSALDEKHHIELAFDEWNTYIVKLFHKPFFKESPEKLRMAIDALQVTINNRVSSPPLFLPVQQTQTEPEVITVSIGQDKYRLFPAEINWIEVGEKGSGGVIVHTSSEILIMGITLKMLLEYLPPQQFLRIHRLFAINKYKIKKFNKKEVTVADSGGKEKSLPVGGDFRDVIDNIS